MPRSATILVSCYNAVTRAQCVCDRFVTVASKIARYCNVPPAAFRYGFRYLGTYRKYASHTDGPNHLHQTPAYGLRPYGWNRYFFFVGCFALLSSILLTGGKKGNCARISRIIISYIIHNHTYIHIQNYNLFPAFHYFVSVVVDLWC